MKPQELINKLIEDETSLADSSATWLENQYPAKPKDRLKKSNYLNYEHLKPFEDLEEIVKKFLTEHLDEKVVIVAKITKTKRLCKTPLLILRKPHSLYYPLYELFACAYHLSGFVELFHNVQ